MNEGYMHAAAKIYVSGVAKYAAKRSSQMLLRMGRANGELSVVESAKNLLAMGY